MIRTVTTEHPAVPSKAPVRSIIVADPMRPTYDGVIISCTVTMSTMVIMPLTVPTMGITARTESLVRSFTLTSTVHKHCGNMLAQLTATVTDNLIMPPTVMHALHVDGAVVLSIRTNVRLAVSAAPPAGPAALSFSLAAQPVLAVIAASLLRLRSAQCPVSLHFVCVPEGDPAGASLCLSRAVLASFVRNSAPHCVPNHRGAPSCMPLRPGRRGSKCRTCGAPGRSSPTGSP